MEKGKKSTRPRKKIVALLVVAAVAALLYSGCSGESKARSTWRMDPGPQPGSATAGIISITSGPTFTPESAFTNNTITVDTSQGSLAHAEGGVTVTSDASNQVTVAISGAYSANAGDVFSLAYSFIVDLNSDTPVPYTASGTATVMGMPIEFHGTGTLVPGLNSYVGEEVAPFAFFFADSGDFSATVVFDFGTLGPQAAAPGTLDFTIQQIDVKLDPTPATVQAPAQLLNISTRLNVGADDNVLIGGFIITGNDPKTVVLRAIGPTLSQFGINGVLADPFLELHDSVGASLATNDDWVDLSSEDQTTLNDLTLAPVDVFESALVATLNPGAFTAIVRGFDNTTGVGLVEAYDVDAGTTDSKLANISTRGFVDTGDNVMIGGIILSGGGGGFSTVVVRGIGPSLAIQGVNGALDDPLLQLFDSDGVVIAENDDWMDDPNMQVVSDLGLAPTDPNESALFMILTPGSYTAVLSGANNANPGGVALVEAYNLD